MSGEQMREAYIPYWITIMTKFVFNIILNVAAHMVKDYS
jgi:hypothetical protein